MYLVIPIEARRAHSLSITFLSLRILLVKIVCKRKTEHYCVQHHLINCVITINVLCAITED